MAAVATHRPSEATLQEPPGRRGSDAGARPLRIAFVMEQVIGHVTWCQNLRRAVSALGEVEARWIETRLFEEDGLLEHVPGIPRVLKAGGRALIDVRRGLWGWPHDVLVFNTQKVAMLCQWQMLHTPTILMTDVTPIQYDQLGRLYDPEPDRNPALRLLKHRANVLNFRLARAVVAWSHWARSSLIHDYGVPPDRAHVITIGTDTTYWRPAPPRAPAERVRILFVGGHFERKGGRLLLDVFRALDLKDRAELHIVTREPVEPAPGVVVHHGVQNNSPELLRLYQEADLFVLPTLADCFGIASIEALAAGLPVVTTAVGGLPEIVKDGVCGYLLPPADARRLGEAVRHLVTDGTARRAFGLAARQRALTRFDARVNAAALLDLACALADGGQPVPAQVPLK